jgi:hypothetical protein
MQPILTQPFPRSAIRMLGCSMLLGVLLAGCTPSVQDCRSILPVASEPVLVTTTPAGTPGCSCLSDGVLVVAEAQRSGFSWSRGQLWVDGTSVSEQDFPARFAQVKAQHQIDLAAAKAQGAAQGVREQVRRAGKALRGFFQH